MGSKSTRSIAFDKPSINNLIPTFPRKDEMFQLFLQARWHAVVLIESGFRFVIL